MVLENFKECPQCGGLMYVSDEYSYKEFKKCYACGYMYLTNMLEGRKPKGYGIVCFVEEGGKYNYYSIVEDCFEKFYKIFIDTLNSCDEIDKEKSYITKWNDKDKKVEVIYGILPENYRVYKEDGDFYP